MQPANSPEPKPLDSSHLHQHTHTHTRCPPHPAHLGAPQAEQRQRRRLLRQRHRALLLQPPAAAAVEHVHLGAAGQRDVLPLLRRQRHLAAAGGTPAGQLGAGAGPEHAHALQGEVAGAGCGQAAGVETWL